MHPSDSKITLDAKMYLLYVLLLVARVTNVTPFRSAISRFQDICNLSFPIVHKKYLIVFFFKM